MGYYKDGLVKGGLVVGVGCEFCGGDVGVVDGFKDGVFVVGFLEVVE